MTAFLPEISVHIIERHTSFPLVGEPRCFTITTIVSGAKRDLAALNERADAVIAAVAESLPDTMSDCEVAVIDVEYQTPQLDHWHRERLKSRPKLPPRYL